MPVITEPIDNGRIFLYRVTPPWSIEEVFEAYERIKEYFDKTTSTVHVLIDLSHVDLIHAGAMRTRHAPFSHYPNIGRIATVTSNDVTRFLAETIMRLSRSSKTKLFRNTEEALAYLRQGINLDTPTSQKES